MQPVILLEANEIPVRLFRDHITRRPDGALARLASLSSLYVTECEDEVELDPWISWPTFHRGVTDAQHGIHHLGQSLDWADREFPPIWRLLKNAGVDVGVFGSLHSSHVPDNATDYAFYLPDFFSAEPYAHPASMMPFQQFNLTMTRRSARNVDTGVPVKEAAQFGVSAFGNGITPSTLYEIASQLAVERVKPLTKIRRRNLQAVIGLDMYISLLQRKRPQFSTFYTNHVAASMHRYWGAHFTDDYPADEKMPQEWIAKYKDEVPAAMDVFDSMVGKLTRYAKSSGSKLMIASSLGQAAVRTKETRGFTTITNTGKLMDFIGLDRADWTPGHAMVPCISVELNPEKVGEAITRLSQLEFMGARAQQNEREIPPLSFDVKNGKSLHLYFYFEGMEPSGEVRLGNGVASAQEAGFGFFVHEDNVACSAHHVSEGLLVIYNPAGPAPSAKWERISSRAVAPALLKHFNVAAPDYMLNNPAMPI